MTRFSTFKKPAAALAVALNLVLAASTAHPYATVPGGRYGDVTVTRPTGPLRGFVVLFSQTSGWSVADQMAANLLAKAGALTVGVDTARYAANLAKQKENCRNLVGDAENIGHQLERQSQSSHYFAPILAGSGEGATLAVKTLAQAPMNTLAGAVSVDAKPTLDPRFMPCPPDPTITHAKGLPGFVETFDGASAGASNTMSSATAGPMRIVALTEPHLSAAPTASDTDVSDLPLVELPAADVSTKPGGQLAIVISGDGGWRDLDKTIAETLQKDGVSVIGWDSLRYFWSEKSPAQTSRDLARVMQTYTTRWHTSRVALIGYSFGADVMPFAYNRLPDALRAQVSLISLLGFAPDADFQIRVGGWLGMPASDKALPVRGEFARLPPGLVQCFYGETEKDTLCPALTHSGADVIRIGGNHHFGGDYSAIEKHILTRLGKQGDAPG
jgi:type IV secretory pathway VirJ component